MTKRYFDLASKEYVESMFDFDCKSECFPLYLKNQALYDKENGFGITHLFIEETGLNLKKVIGFFTLKNASLVLTDEEEGTRNGYPAIEIAQFATCKEMEGQGIGRIMINSIIAKAHELANESAIKFIVLCSVEESIGFYGEMEFKPLDDERVKMFIPRENCNKKCYPMFKNIIMEKE